MIAARALFPGGVNSPVRAYRAVGGEPPVLVRGKGPYVWDDAGRRYVDYVGAFGPLVIGHADHAVVAAIAEAAEAGGPFGVTGRGEIRLAEQIAARMPSIERIRFVNSGTEAAMSALRVARAATGRELVIKFDGGYHGHADSLLVEAGSGVATLSIPGSAGVARSVAASNVTINFLLPGAFDTDRLASNMAATAKKQGISIDEARTQRVAVVPAKRFGTAEEFGAACAFLCSAQAGYITGQSLLIDGGVYPGVL